MSAHENQLLEEIKNELADIKRILGGDYRTGKNGLVQSTENLLADVYDKKNGLLKRTGDLETAKWKFLFTLSGICGIITLGWKVFIDWLTSHPKS